MSHTPVGSGYILLADAPGGDRCIFFERIGVRYISFEGGVVWVGITQRASHKFSHAMKIDQIRTTIALRK